MDTWLDSEDFSKLIEELNPQLNTVRDYDANWANLRREVATKPDPFARTVRTRTPALLEFEKNYSFVYRRYDGAHWHTELRDVDIKYQKSALTSEQRRLRENLATILALKDCEYTPVWITPVDQRTDQYDPKYQLVRIHTLWYCWINGGLYEVSNTRKQPGKTYHEHTFSTRNKPVFTLESTESLLDKLLGEKL